MNFVGLCLVEQSVGRVTNLRVVETLGNIVRLGWTGVSGATQYDIVILNTQCEKTLSINIAAVTLVTV